LEREIPKRIGFLRTPAFYLSGNVSVVVINVKKKTPNNSNPTETTDVPGVTNALVDLRLFRFANPLLFKPAQQTAGEYNAQVNLQNSTV
jgi:hypothetical protein